MLEEFEIEELVVAERMFSALCHCATPPVDDLPDSFGPNEFSHFGRLQAIAL